MPKRKPVKNKNIFPININEKLKTLRPVLLQIAAHVCTQIAGHFQTNKFLVKQV